MASALDAAKLSLPCSVCIDEYLTCFIKHALPYNLHRLVQQTKQQVHWRGTI